jgi:carbonic anhydrase
LHEEIIQYEQQARKDFTDAMHKTKDEMIKMKQDTNQRVDQLSQNIDKILELSKETRKDNIRIQLLMIMEHQPENVDTILKIAEKYFIKLKGDWYMTNEFSKWAKEHNVTIPAHLYDVIDSNNHEEE